MGMQLHKCMVWSVLHVRRMKSLIRGLSYHFSVVLIAEVKHGQDGLELVQDLIVSGHVCGQDTPDRDGKNSVKELENIVQSPA